MRAFFGILGLAGAGFMISSVTSVGCSSSSGGSTGTGGSSSTGTAGSQGTAGTTGGGGSGGSGGGGGASTAAGCQASELAPGDTGAAYVIADFTAMDAGTLPIGGFFTYASPTGAVSPTATIENGGWHITLNAPAMATDPQYIGVGIYFNGNAAGDECIDATAHTGVKFDVSGMIGSACTAQYSTNDSAHSAASASDKKAGGPAGAYAPQAPLTVTSAVTTVMVPFVGGSLGTGSPATSIDKSKLTGVQWQFTVPAGTGTCMVDIIIDNVAFY